MLAAPGEAAPTPGPDCTDAPDDPFVGFVAGRDGIDRVDLPGDGDMTILAGITNRGQIVGKTPDDDGLGFDGLVGDRGGLRRFDFPGAMATYAHKANERGVIVGSANRESPNIGAQDAPGTIGYKLDRGRFTRIAYPDAVHTQARRRQPRPGGR